jgi:hypothetical protein
MPSNWPNMNDVVLTLDIDWAPDFAISWVARRLIEAEVRATWFITHLSPAVGVLRDHPELFELGIHPNFLTGSTHGASPGAVLDHCMTLVPDATSMRSHALVQSSPLMARVLSDTPIVTDVSLFLPRAPSITPVEYRHRGRILTRIPYFWEDDSEMEYDIPCWGMKTILGVDEGLKVFDFHPIHVYLNSADMGPYRWLKSRSPDLSTATEVDAAPLVHGGEGTQSLLLEIIEHLATTGGSSCIRELGTNAHAQKDT